MVHPIKVVGIGPGHQDYLLPAALKAVREADYLVGGARALALFAHLDKPCCRIDKNLARLVPQLKDWRQKGRVAVLVSGDPGFYSLLNYLRRHFPGSELEVIPGLSSMQLAFARLGISWHDARFASVHGRPLETLLRVVEPGVTVAILTSGQNDPGAVAEFLTGKITGDPRVYLCDSLGEPGEKIISTRLSRVVQQLKNCSLKNCIMVITSE